MISCWDLGGRSVGEKTVLVEMGYYCLSFVLFEMTKLCLGHRSILVHAVISVVAVVYICVHEGVPSRKSQRPAAASYHVYSPITSTVAELQLVHLQCS